MSRSSDGSQPYDLVGVQDIGDDGEPAPLDRFRRDRRLHRHVATSCPDIAAPSAAANAMSMPVA